MIELDRDDWDDDAPTDVDKWLAIYAQDSSLFWSCSIGHIQNVLDELIWRVRNIEQATEKRIIEALEKNYFIHPDDWVKLNQVIKGEQK